MQTCIIIGAGIAGAQVATSMRQAGFKGAIKLIGEEPIAPYERPPLSKSFLTSDNEARPVGCFAARHYEENQIELVLGSKVQAIDTTARHVTLSNGEVLSYAVLVLATGSRARQLSIPGAESVHTLRNVRDAQALREQLKPSQKVICIGAGVIGLELASSACAIGGDVTVVEYGKTVMGRSLPRNLASIVEGLHTERGVAFQFEREVAQLDEKRLVFKNGESLEADVVIAGVGAVRNTELAKEAGIAIDTGILVDEFGRTNAPYVYAAGEVAEYYSPRLGLHLTAENWNHAQRHAANVGAGIAGTAALYDETPRFWTDQHGIKIQVVGNAEHGAFTVFRGDPSTKRFSAFQFNDKNVPLTVIGFDASQDVIGGGKLVERALPIEPDLIKDTTVPLKAILRQQVT